MQLLDDDMDELFRNAASRYPLKTDGSDWDAVMSRLPQSDDQLPGAGNRFTWLRWLRWPLLISLALFGSVSMLKMAGLPDKNNNIITVNNNKGSYINKVEESNKNSYVERADSSNSNAVKNNIIAGKIGDVTKVDDSYSNNHVVKNNIIVRKDSYSNAADNTLNLHGLYTKNRDKDINAELSKNKITDHIAIWKDTTNTKAPKKEPVQKGLYAGLVLSPDFSTVKGQKVSKPGYGGGLLLGYRISKNVAVETGVLYERKYYYSTGQYFDGKKIGVPSDMKIINVDGWCQMIEIPVNVRYIFGIKPGHNWYVSAGVSSYIMGRENYDYKYERNGYTSTKNWDYRNESRNWFSIINVGVGYQHRLGAIGTLRVEPYLKMPASGIGIGNLPLTSVGLNVGITRSIRF